VTPGIGTVAGFTRHPHGESARSGAKSPVGEKRYAEAEEHILAGYNSSPSKPAHRRLGFSRPGRNSWPSTKH